ncbi:hypothetical protein CGLO_13854 [Colletotrichum gloeosporioides Cg-14]|uniref:Uncharacterized protein n=1 Tax=Colletotrichum gloeosporioides (strain Cg-14) TaxID=1237896 RepID=T0K565_COLGC|nr:hypothetical protein CGLO_13854 [Colletotrichum gloeosporioides Cg-14]
MRHDQNREDEEKRVT